MFYFMFQSVARQPPDLACILSFIDKYQIHYEHCLHADQLNHKKQKVLEQSIAFLQSFIQKSDQSSA